MMPFVLRRAFRNLAVFVTLLTFVSGSTAWARRVGFVNAARDGAAGLGAIDGSRGQVVKALGPDEIAPGPGRDALEAPLGGGDADSGTLERAKKLLDGAQDAYKAFEYDTAFDRLRQADTALRGLYPSAEVVAMLAEVNLLLGQVWLARQDEARAVEAFRVVRRLQPERTGLDAARFRPQVVKAFDKAAAPAAGQGMISVATEPPGATVWLDGKAVGAAPVELTTVAPGDHYVTATLDGHVARAERVTVGAGQKHEQTFLLARLPAEQRARAIRVGLVRGSGDWLRAATDLADVASVDVLVLVRDREGGGFEWAAFDLKSGKLGRWVGVDRGVPALVDTVPRPPEDRKISVPRPEDLAKKVPVGPGVGQPGVVKPGPKPRWYRTWWGTSLLIGGGLAILGGVIWATAPGASDWPVDTCWEGTCQ